MFIVFDSNLLVVEQTDTLQDFAYYVAKSLSVKEIEYVGNCVGKIFTSNLLLSPPTPYHSAKNGNWIITEENSLLLSQVIASTCEKILAYCQFGADGDFFESVGRIMLNKNKAKAYSLLKSLSSSAPKYCNFTLE